MYGELISTEPIIGEFSVTIHLNGKALTTVYFYGLYFVRV